MSSTSIFFSVNQAIKLARFKLVSHRIQANELAKDAVDVCYGSSKGRISSRRKTRREKERPRRRIELVSGEQEEGGAREKDTYHVGRRRQEGKKEVKT